MSVKACVKPRLTLDHSDEDEPLVSRRARLNQLRVDFKSSSSLLRPHKEWEKPGSDVQIQKGQSSSALKENPIQSSKPLVSETQKSSPSSSEDSEDGMRSSSSHGHKDSNDGMPSSSSDNEDSKDKGPLDGLNDRSSDVCSDDEPLIFRKTKPRYLRSDLEESLSLVGPDKQLGKLCHVVQTLSYRDSSSLKLEMGHLLKGTQKLLLASSKPYLSPPSSRLPLLKLPLVNGVSAANHEIKKDSSILVKGENGMSHKEDCSNDEPDDSEGDMPLSSSGSEDSDDNTIDTPVYRSDSEESEDDMSFSASSSDQSSSASDDDEPLILRKTKLNRLGSDLKKSSSSFRAYTQLGTLGANIQNDQGFSAPKGKDFLSQKSSSSKPASGTQKSSPSSSSVQTVSPSSAKPSPSLPSYMASHLKSRMANVIFSANHKTKKDTTMPVKKDHLHDESENSQYDTSLSASDSKNSDDDTPLNTIDAENSEDDVSLSVASNYQTSSAPSDDEDEPSVCRKRKLTQLGSVLKNSTLSIGPDNQLGKMGFDVGRLSEQSSSASSDDEPLVLRKFKLKQRSSDLKNSAPSVRPDKQLVKLGSDVGNPNVQNSSALKRKAVQSLTASSFMPDLRTRTLPPPSSRSLKLLPLLNDQSLSLPSSKASPSPSPLVRDTNIPVKGHKLMPIEEDISANECKGSEADMPLTASKTEDSDYDTSLSTDLSSGLSRGNSGMSGSSQSQILKSLDDSDGEKSMSKRSPRESSKRASSKKSDDCDVLPLAAELHQNVVFKRENETKNALLTSTKRTSADTGCYQSLMKKAKLSHAFNSAKVQQNPLEANAEDDDDHLPVAKQKYNAESAKEGEKTLALPVDVDSSYHAGSIPVSEHKRKLAAASVRETLIMCTHRRKRDKTSLDATSAQAHEKHNRRLTELQFSQSSVDGSDSYGSQGRKHLSIESQRDIGKVSADLMNKGKSNGFGETDSMCSCAYDVSHIYRRKTAALIDDAQSEKYKKELEKEKKENKQLEQRLNHAQKELLRVQKELLQINRVVQTVIDQLNLPFLTCKLTSGAHNDDDDHHDNNDEVDDDDDDDSVGENGGGDDDE
ncbi:hypothetical protein Cgig2_024347 [Carnegiea gigantea]|uniref:Uncharacterized protein n=1 Tax=Carnegiea gigantea TaxID=171969 RepID=A0A9Q1QC13_9CARY|nr:hypothetical protein Cgig2_024347 [Carnegiea gigantea]